MAKPCVPFRAAPRGSVCGRGPVVKGQQGAWPLVLPAATESDTGLSLPVTVQGIFWALGLGRPPPAPPADSQMG